MDERTRSSRSHETRIVLNATPDEVWRALTDPEELARWFPSSAEVTAGPGGVIKLAWGSDFVGTCDIKVWEPGRHLRTGWMEFGGTPSRNLVVDYIIESHGGQTILRVVHSGFGPGKEWDNEYDGTRRGWPQELSSLGIYFDRHRGRDRRHVWVRVPISITEADAWSRLMGRDGLWGRSDIGELAPGRDFSTTLTTGEPVAGKVELCRAPSDFAAVLDSHDGAYFRISIDRCHGGPEAQIWLSLWGPRRDEASSLVERWGARMKDILDTGWATPG